MKTLELNQMEIIDGGAFEGWGSKGCNTAMMGLAGTVGSAFLGPAGVVTGLLSFGSFVNNISSCSGSDESN